MPPDMVADGYKDQTTGHFRIKCKEADCLLKQIEPHFPWMNSAEADIRKLKRSSYQIMIKCHIPKKLWDYCLELEARIHYCTVNDIYLCENECPETIMKG